MRNFQSPCVHASTWRISMKLENGGSTKRSTMTWATLNAIRYNGPFHHHPRQRRGRRAGIDCSPACTARSRPNLMGSVPTRIIRRRAVLTDMTDHDRLTRFLLPHAGVRGVHVRLDDTWRRIRDRSDYAPALSELLGEACAAAA